MARGLETTHGPLALTGRLMGVFGTLVQPFMAVMRDTRHDLLVGSRVTAELVGDQHAGAVLAALEQLAEERLGGRLVSSALHQDIEHVPFLVNRPPQVKNTSSKNHLSPGLARRRRS